MMEEVSNDVSVGEDVDFFYRLVFKAETLTIRSYCPYHYRQHSESMMRKKIDIESIKKLYFDLLTINGVKKEDGMGNTIKQIYHVCNVIKNTR